MFAVGQRKRKKFKSVNDKAAPLSSESPINAQLSNEFICEFIVEGQPWGRLIPCITKVYHPKEINGSCISTIEGSAIVGLKNAFHWRFEFEEELQPGKWRITFEFPEHSHLAMLATELTID
jgi:hypothetical protein